MIITEESSIEGASIKSLERCTPDYEKMISGQKRRLKRSADFRDAIIKYFKGQQARDSLAMLLGELVTRCNLLEHELECLIKQQEVSNKQ